MAQRDNSQEIGPIETWTDSQKQLDRALHNHLFYFLPVEYIQETDLDLGIENFFQNSDLPRDPAIEYLVKKRYLAQQEAAARIIDEQQREERPATISVVTRSAELAGMSFDQSPEEVTSKILAGEAVWLFHRFKDPANLSSLVRDGFRSNYAFAHNGHWFQPIHFSTTPPGTIIPDKDLVLQFQGKIFDHRGETFSSAEKIIDQGFVGSITLVRERSELANTNLEVMLYDGNSYLESFGFLESAVDAESFQVLSEILSQNLSDQEIIARLPELENFLPLAVKRLKGTRLDEMHGGNMYDHTLSVLTRLDTGRLRPISRQIARWTALFHDAGKIGETRDKSHNEISAKLARKYFQGQNISENWRKSVIRQVRFHDALGLVLQGMSISSLPDKFKSYLDLDIHYAVAQADIGCTFPREINRLREVYEQASKLF